jgi:hypothetical protein
MENHADTLCPTKRVPVWSTGLGDTGGCCHVGGEAVPRYGVAGVGNEYGTVITVGETEIGLG